MQATQALSLGSGGRALIVIALHVAVVYLIATSLGIVPAPKITEPMQAVLIQTPQETKPVEPTVKPDLVEPTVDVPEPETVPIPDVQVPVETSNAISVPATDAVEATQLQVSNRVEPLYPPASRRLGEEGTAVFRVLVDEHGRPLEVNVLKSSGFNRLDDAAMQAIRKWVFVPPTQAGQPVRSWSRVQVKFQLS